MEVRKLYEQSTMAFSEFLYIFYHLGHFLTLLDRLAGGCETSNRLAGKCSDGLWAPSSCHIHLFFFPTLAKYVHNKRLITILAIGSLLTALLYIPSTGFTALLIVTILFSVFYPALLPAVESSAATLVQYGNIHYGKSRSYGSFGFVIAVLIISMLTGVFERTSSSGA